MSSRPNADFFAPVQSRRDGVRERLAQQRAALYEWRHDFHDSCFDACSGERRRKQNSFDPRAKRRFVATRDGVDSKADRAENPHVPLELPSSLRQQTLNKVDDNGVSSASPPRPATTTLWEAAATSPVDHRRAWKNSGFTFPAGHFHRNISSAPARAYHSDYSGSSVHIPYLHDTILLCEPLKHSQETAIDSVGRLATDFAKPLPPTSGSGSAAATLPDILLAVTCNATEARARELQASVEAKRADLLRMSTVVTVTGDPQPPQELDKVMPTSVATTVALAEGSGTSRVRHGATGAEKIHIRREDTLPTDAPTSETPTETWCDVVGPSIALKQRSVAMAEAVYNDLVMSRSKGRSAAAPRWRGDGVGLAGYPAEEHLQTCELAYSLRPSYVESRLRHSASRRSGNSGTLGAGSSCYSALDKSSDHEVRCAVSATSPLEADASMLRDGGHAMKSYDTSRPPSDGAETRSPAPESLTSTAVASMTTDVPPALNPIENVADEGHLNSSHLPHLQVGGTASTLHFSSCLHPNGSEEDRAAVGADVAGCGLSDVSRPHRGLPEQPRGIPGVRRAMKDGSFPAASQSQAQLGKSQQPSFTVHRMPTEAKETRVYAVRVRRTFKNADASIYTRAEPPRRGVPVTLPPDWLLSADGFSSTHT